MLVALIMTPLAADAAPQSKKFPKCCVWRVINAKAPFYLVGSIHALSKKDYPLPKPYDMALKDSTRFLFEFDPTRHAEFQKKFEAAAKYPPGQDIRSKISPALLAWLRKNMFTMIPDARGGTGERWLTQRPVLTTLSSAKKSRGPRQPRFQPAITALSKSAVASGRNRRSSVGTGKAEYDITPQAVRFCFTLQLTVFPYSIPKGIGTS